MSKVILAGTLGVLMFFGTGCPKDNVQKVALASRDFAAGLETTQALVESLGRAEMLSKEEELKLQHGLVKLGKVGLEFNSAVRDSQGKDIPEIISRAISAVEWMDREGVLPVKNPEARGALRVAFATAKTALSIITTVFPPKGGN